MTKKLHLEQSEHGRVIQRYVGSPLGSCLTCLREELVLEQAGDHSSLLDALIPSEEMREYLKKQKLNMETIQDIIGGAPMPLEEKIKLLRTYSPKAASIMQEALDALDLQPGERLCMYRGKFVPDSWEWSHYQELGEYASYEAALQQVRMDMGNAPAGWTILTKLVPDGNGNYMHTYTCYLVEDKIVYFSEHSEDRPFRWYERSPNLRIPSPFEPGDIVTYDSEPFAPRKNAVVLGKDRSSFGDLITLLYRSEEDGGWEYGELHCNQCWAGLTQPMLSAQYRIATCRDELPQEERLLKTVRDYIAGDGEKGSEFLHKINSESLERGKKRLAKWDEARFNHTEVEEDDEFSDALSTEDILKIMSE